MKQGRLGFAFDLVMVSTINVGGKKEYGTNVVAGLLLILQ